MTRLQDQIDELTHDNEKLQYENQGLKVKLDAMQDQPVLVMGTEIDFYPGEIKDLILASLNTYLQSIGQRTRRYDVIQDIIQTNDYQGTSKQRADEVKRLLSSYTGMTGKIKKGLEDVGFEIEHEGDHYKAIYYGDDRYIAVYGTTPSDVKAGKNNASNTIKKVF